MHSWGRTSIHIGNDEYPCIITLQPRLIQGGGGDAEGGSGGQEACEWAEHPDTLTAMHDLASSLSYQGQYNDAEAMQREVLGDSKCILGAEHPDTLMMMHNLALLLSNQGRYKEAEVMQREVLGVRKRMSGAEHPDTLMAIHNLALSLSDQGRHKEAEAM